MQLLKGIEEVYDDSIARGGCETNESGSVGND